MDFHVLETTELTQTATMTLRPGEASGPDSENEHAASEQIIYLAQGELQAQIGDRSFVMRRGDSAIVGRGQTHRFVNSGSSDALTFNVYAPPAY